jgi:hypothetical protein
LLVGALKAPIYKGVLELSAVDFSKVPQCCFPCVVPYGQQGKKPPPEEVVF